MAQKVLPAATHLRLPGCGHVPMSDNPTLVAEVLLAGSAPVRGFSASCNAGSSAGSGAGSGAGSSAELAPA